MEVLAEVARNVGSEFDAAWKLNYVGNPVDASDFNPKSLPATLFQDADGKVACENLCIPVCLSCAATYRPRFFFYFALIVDALISVNRPT